MNKNTTTIYLFLENIFRYLFVFMVILDCNSIYLTDYSSTVNFRYVLYFFMISSIFAIIYLRKNVLISKLVIWIKYISIAIIFIGLLFLFRPTSFPATSHFLMSVLIIITYFALCGTNNERFDVLKKYKRVMVVIGIISLAFWILGSQLNIIAPTGYLPSTWIGDDTQVSICPSYYNIYFETQATNSFEQEAFIRNTAFFTEGPMASFNFALAFMITIFLDDRKSVLEISILVIAILSTVSSTGYMVLALSLFFKFLIRDTSGIIRLIKYIFVPICTIITTIACLYVLIDKSETSSLLIRLDDFVVGYDTWMDNPIFGYGIGGEQHALQNHMGQWRLFNMGFSNSLFDILAKGGLYLGSVIYCAFAYIIFKGISTKMYNIISFMLIFLFMHTVTVVSLKMIVLCVIISLVMYPYKEFISKN